MENIEESIIRKIMDEKEFTLLPKFLAQVQRLVLEDLKRAKENKNFIARTPRIGKYYPIQ